jgi:hypothetical protein
LKLRPIIDGLFEETDSINYDVIVDQLRKKCGPFIRANRDNFQQANLLYRGIRGDYKVGDVVELTVRKDRRPLDSSKEFHELMNTLLSVHVGVKWRSEALFAVSSMDTARSYGNTVVAVFPIGKYSILRSDEVRDMFTELAPPKRSPVKPHSRNFQALIKWSSFPDDQKTHGKPAVDALVRAVLKYDIVRQVYDILRTNGKAFNDQQSLAIANLLGREIFSDRMIKSVATSLLHEFGSTLIDNIHVDPLSTDKFTTNIIGTLTPKFETQHPTSKFAVDDHDLKMILDTYRTVLMELPAVLIDTIKRVCEGILMDFIDSYYVDSKFSGSGENGSSGEQMIACNKYMAVVIATKSDHPVKFNTLRLLGELSK